MTLVAEVEVNKAVVRADLTREFPYRFTFVQIATTTYALIINSVQEGVFTHSEGQRFLRILTRLVAAWYASQGGRPGRLRGSSAGLADFASEARSLRRSSISRGFRNFFGGGGRSSSLFSGRGFRGGGFRGGIFSAIASVARITRGFRGSRFASSARLRGSTLGAARAARVGRVARRARIPVRSRARSRVGGRTRVTTRTRLTRGGRTARITRTQLAGNRRQAYASIRKQQQRSRNRRREDEFAPPETGTNRRERLRRILTAFYRSIIELAVDRTAEEVLAVSLSDTYGEFRANCPVLTGYMLSTISFLVLTPDENGLVSVNADYAIYTNDYSHWATRTVSELNGHYLSRYFNVSLR